MEKKKKKTQQWKVVKNGTFLTWDTKSIFILASLIGFFPISSQEFYISWTSWRCLQHLDTCFPFFSYWSLKNSVLWYKIWAILLKCQDRVFSLQYSGNIYFSFSSAVCCTFQKVGGHWCYQVSQICEKHLPQKQTPLGCRMALETQTLSGLCTYEQIGGDSARNNLAVEYSNTFRTDALTNPLPWGASGGLPPA